MARHNEVGQKGEEIASKYLEKKGFTIQDRNYRKKWGEIDIVAFKDKVLHFVEVKTVSRRSFGGHFEQEVNNFRPEDNMHPWKLKGSQERSRPIYWRNTLGSNRSGNLTSCACFWIWREGWQR